MVRVLITGGELVDRSLLKSAEIYDPATGVFTQLSRAMSIGPIVHSHSFTDGTVLIVGGKQADVWDPVTQIFTTVPSLPIIGALTPHRSCRTEGFS